MSKNGINKLKVNFSKVGNGWIHISLEVDGKHIFFQNNKDGIMASRVYSPFWNLWRFLREIISCNLPSHFRIDEEGIEKDFDAKPHKNKDLFYFSISDVVYNKKEKPEVYLEGIFDKKQFVKEWGDKLDDLIFK